MAMRIHDEIRNFLLSSLVLVEAFLICGCKSPYRGSVYREWSDRMSEMGIFPVYPPREDIVVGDVYALPLHPYDNATVGYIGGLGSAGIHVSYLGDTNVGWSGLLKSLNNYYLARPYPADTTNTTTNSGGGSMNDPLPMTRIEGYGEPNADARTGVFVGGSTARLRQVAFPDFSVSTVSQGSLSAVIPIEAIMASLNFNYNDVKAVHFKIPQAESYGLTTEELLRDIYGSNLIKYTNGSIYLDGTTNSVISVAGAQMAHAMFLNILHTLMEDPTSPVPAKLKRHVAKSAERMRDQMYLALISEVYYARSIDITIDRTKARGASGSARPISADELKKLVDLGLAKATRQTITTNVNPAAGTNTPSSTTTELVELSAGDDAFSLAKKLRDLQTPEGISNVGGSVKVLSVSASNIGLRRVFERPVAVGVRGVLLKVDVNHPVKLDSSPTNIWMKVESFGSPAEGP